MAAITSGASGSVRGRKRLDRPTAGAKQELLEVPLHIAAPAAVGVGGLGQLARTAGAGPRR